MFDPSGASKDVVVLRVDFNPSFKKGTSGYASLDVFKRSNHENHHIMLVNPRFNHDLQMGLILGVISGGKSNVQLETGIYEIGHFSLNHQISDVVDEYYDFGELDACGVCDEIVQVKEKFSKWINDPSLKFCISFTKIVKSEQSSPGGWRWHKWGSYIGVKNPQYEYIADEGPEIEHVYVYHIYKLKD